MNYVGVVGGWVVGGSGVGWLGCIVGDWGGKRCWIGCMGMRWLVSSDWVEKSSTRLGTLLALEDSVFLTRLVEWWVGDGVEVGRVGCWLEFVGGVLLPPLVGGVEGGLMLVERWVLFRASDCCVVDMVGRGMAGGKTAEKLSFRTDVIPMRGMR